MDESTQVCGVEHFVDCTGYGVEHQTFLGLGEIQTMAEHFSVSTIESIQN